MADTIHVLNWSLQRPCPYRTGTGWHAPAATIKATRGLQALSTTLSISISGNFVVTGWSYSKAGTRPLGYRISEVFAKYGGLKTARATCATCEANIYRERTDKMGGCFGSVGIDPHSDELQSALAESIQKHAIRAAVADSFPPTNPMWYGFWINSPLTARQCELLARILPDVYLLDLDDRRILLALRAAVEHQLPLHVQLTPLGHTDFGFYTIFPHCPRCKAFSGLRWQKEYSRSPMQCKVCDISYVPADTASSEADVFDDELIDGNFTEAEVAEILKTQAPPPHPMERFRTKSP